MIEPRCWICGYRFSFCTNCAQSVGYGCHCSVPIHMHCPGPREPEATPRLFEEV